MNGPKIDEKHRKTKATLHYPKSATYSKTPIRHIAIINLIRYIICIYLMGDNMQTAIYTSKQLATMLRGRRKALGLTQKDVASLVGLLPKTVSALETNPDRCSVESLRTLLVALSLELTLASKDENASAVRKAEW